MQLSEFRDLLANDGFAATFQTMGQYRTELLRALDGLRAKADARPVAWTNAKELEGVKTVSEGYARAIWGAENESFATIPLFTHPEASAPGLSERERYLIDKAAERLREADFIDEASAVRAILTRASAATVAEPGTDNVWPIVNITVSESGEVTAAKLYAPGLPAGNHDVYPVRVPYMDEHTEAWMAVANALKEVAPGYLDDSGNGIECAVKAIHRLAAQQQAEPPHCYAFMTCASPAICAKAGHCVNTFDESKRAEPVGDECAEIYLQDIEALMRACVQNIQKWSFPEYDSAHRAVKKLRALFAAQSGQRAGVGEGWKPIDTAPEIKGDYFFCDLAWGPDEDLSTGKGFRWNGRWFVAAIFYDCMARNGRQYFFREIEVTPKYWMERAVAPTPAAQGGV